MEKLDPEIHGSSKNIIKENIDKLKNIFPDVFTEGKIDFDKLKETLGEYIEDNEERYSFSWHGKSKARRIAQTPSTGTLRPCKEESKNWDTTQNLFIEGDNLEVLKLLQKSYHKKIKMIYIDPPYNTGKEFIYPDNYKDNLNTYLRYSGQIDDEGYKFSSNTEQSGRYHTNWLNMMYPRLKLARNLLRDDGVIFISIDEVEHVNLKKICGEIFGEDNFIANAIWEKKFSPQNDAKWFSDNHDHVLIFAKNKELWRPYKLPRTEETNSRFFNPDNDPRGIWASSDMSVKTYNEKYDYSISTPSGRIIKPANGRCWSISRSKFNELVADNRVWFGNNGSNVPRYKSFLSEMDDGIVPLTIWKHTEVGHNQEARQETKNLFHGKAYFDNPKPTRLLKRICTLSVKKDDIVLDFFSGSCTTAQAVIELNIENKHNCNFIMIQLPEPCDKKSEAFKAGYKTIAEIGKERIRRAGDKIVQENKDKKGIENLDIGFKVFKLDSSNIKPWDADFDNLEDAFRNFVENIKNDRTEDDVLYELLLKYGLDLTLPIEERKISGKTVFSIGFGALVICLDSDITIDVVEGIGKLKKELDPEIMRVVFKDSGFKDDVVKTNAIQILKQYSIDDVKSL